MAISLITLPYAEDALAPAISATTVQTHHGKHHRTYVDRTNTAIEGGDLADKPLEDIVAAAEAKGDKGLFNNSAQTWNHGFYWFSLAPTSAAPTGDLAAAIESSFGSFDALKQELAAQGTAHFASGWVWLVEKNGKLSVEQTHDAATYTTLSGNPLLVIDLWEHAYYLDHKNVRPNYLKDVIDNHLNWEFAAENFGRGALWTYPA
ncbi:MULTISPECIES: superoxide dismutase [unclassified Novosphingobium]|jgi:Fe-Mn family superoxide dismutase|uniref:superoxide dismutase n=1 Tax=unclassified Novosphingobium TaxID=2644732 RepID=UPI00061BB38C|nr:MULTISPECIES: superoxide dismutase [unclassified Novosphingobium]QCI94150.1 superoxide dismutase [Novosphingobium sp. EMRT-2]GAO54278.1 Fe-dependent superoxide dismutase [Novosphingobium sp. MD-1]